MSARALAGFAGIALALFATVATAAESKTFEAASFASAQSAGKAIVVDISAPWCPTCAAQKPIVESLAASDAYKDLVIFHVDFDSQKDAVRSLGARMQSTLIAYSGETETGRSVGDTQPDSIAALFRSTGAK